MDGSIAPWEAWVRTTWLSKTVLANFWLWPTLETLHYLGLCLLLGAVGLFDLRVLGLFKGLSPAALHRLVPVGVAGFGLNLVTGICFFAGYPEQYAYNNAFRVKLALMAVAAVNLVLFYSTAFKNARATPAGASAPPLARLLAGVSLGCWLGVLTAGRLLTFFRPPFFH